MNSRITDNDISKFLTRVYFGEIKEDSLLENTVQLAINRAYLDFCRTLHGFSKVKNHNQILLQSKLCLKDRIFELINNEAKMDHDLYDKWHKETCVTLKNVFYPENFYYGQAQKWINMTQKYLFVLEKRIVENIWSFFHVPIDNIILDKLKNDHADCPEFETPWSKIDNYEKYMMFQRWIRGKFLNEIPMDKEFKLWME